MEQKHITMWAVTRIGLPDLGTEYFETRKAADDFMNKSPWDCMIWEFEPTTNKENER